MNGLRPQTETNETERNFGIVYVVVKINSANRLNTIYYFMLCDTTNSHNTVVILLFSKEIEMKREETKSHTPKKRKFPIPKYHRLPFELTPNMELYNDKDTFTKIPFVFSIHIVHHVYCIHYRLYLYTDA